MPEWRKQNYAAPPPYHVEHHGAAYMVCDSRGYNVAHTERGAVLFAAEQDAQAVCDSLNASES